MGPQGEPCHVFRPWTEADLAGNLAFLPPFEANGEKFAEAIEAFCKEFSPTFAELRCLLPQKMGAVAYVKIREKLVGDDRMVKPSWTDPENRHYKLAVEYLANHIRAQFPRKCDTSKVTMCKQLKGETIDKYLDRLTEVFNKFSGITPPAATGAVTSPLE